MSFTILGMANSDTTVTGVIAIGCFETRTEAENFLNENTRHLTDDQISEMNFCVTPIIPEKTGTVFCNPEKFNEVLETFMNVIGYSIDICREDKPNEILAFQDRHGLNCVKSKLHKGWATTVWDVMSPGGHHLFSISASEGVISNIIHPVWNELLPEVK